MREAFLYHLFSGDLFFTACAAVFVATAVDLLGVTDRRPQVKRLANFAAVLSAGLAALSGTPMPLGEAVLVVAICCAYLLFGFGAAPRLRRSLGISTLVAVLFAAAVELPFHLSPALTATPRRMIVLGDSLSAGGFGERAAWPTLAVSRLRIPVINLASPSDTAVAAVTNQLPGIPPAAPGDLVIVALGGNDMLEGVPVRDFSRAFETLLRSAREDGARSVLVFEMPVLPGRWAYGAATRNAVRRSGAELIPKRVMVGVLSHSGNTSDGVHLRQRGHDALAEAVVTLLRRGRA